MGNIEIEFPAMYIINKFIGTCFKGANAKSHDFLFIKCVTSVFFETSETVGIPDALYAGGDAKPSVATRLLLKYQFIITYRSLQMRVIHLVKSKLHFSRLLEFFDILQCMTLSL